MRGDRSLGRCWTLLIAAQLSACAMLQAGPDDPAGSVLSKTSAACDALTSDVQALVASAGVASAYGSPVPGFAVLRLNRSLAAAPVPDQRLARARWLETVIAVGRAAMTAELSGLGSGEQATLPTDVLARLVSCDRQAAQALLRSHQAFEAWRGSHRVPSSYLGPRVPLARAIARPFLRSGVRDWQQDYLSAWDRAPDAPVMIYRPPAVIPERRRAWVAEQRAMLVSAGSMTVPPASTLARWIARHAPEWAVETAGAADQLGAPWRDGDGALRFDAAGRSVFVQLGQGVYQGRWRLQINYLIWFPERPKTSLLDPYGGRLDGVIWRATLDAHGQALVYDSIHACGCFHVLFPVETHMRARRPGEPNAPAEPVLVPTRAPSGPVRVRLAASTHLIRSVEAAGGAGQRAGVFRLRPYTDLLKRPALGGEGVFAADGLVPESRRGERFFLWPSGVPSPGAMRIWGRHATAFLGQAHFDDPAFLETKLVAAEPEPK